MPVSEAPTNFDDESSPENSLAAELDVGNAVPVVAQLRLHTPELPQMPPAAERNTFGGVRLPTIRLIDQRMFANAQAAAAAERRPRTVGLTTDIFAEIEAELNEAESLLRVGLASPPVVNIMPLSLPPQVAEPQLDEILRRVTQRTDLHNVETVRLRVISAITVSLSRLAMFLPRLQHLDLSGSVLCSLRDLGCGLIHLTHLNVSNCGLNSFDGTSGMPSVSELIADGNMIQRLGPLAQLPLLQRLSVRNNRISDLSLLTFLAMCPNLFEVAFQGNPVFYLPLYRHTLQRNVRTLRLIDGTSVEEENSIETTEIPHSADNNVEIERVAELNRRNVYLGREISITLNTSTHDSSSLSTSESPTNTTSDNEDLSSLSSEYQLANEAIESLSSSPKSGETFLSAISPPREVSNLSSSLASLTAIRCLRRPATAPNGSSTTNTFGTVELANRPASALVPGQRQQPVLQPGAAGTSIIAGSILDLVRQQRRCSFLQRNRQAWGHEGNDNSSSESSSTASNRSSTLAVEFN